MTTHATASPGWLPALFGAALLAGLFAGCVGGELLEGSCEVEDDCAEGSSCSDGVCVPAAAGCPARDRTDLYVDGDDDGVGMGETVKQGCPDEDGYSAVTGECDDSNGTVVMPLDYFVDADLDGVGSAALGPESSCRPVPDKILVGGDCDDSDPGLGQLADYYVDADQDGVGSAAVAAESSCRPVAGKVLAGGDCDDSDPRGTQFADYYVDADQDGVGSSAVAAENSCAPVPGKVTTRGDCDEGDPTVRPTAEEACLLDPDQGLEVCAPAGCDSSVADVVLQGFGASGRVVAGDFDGDGHDDLAIGSYGAGSETGAVHIVFGPLRRGTSAIADGFSIASPGPNSAFGGCIASPGDVDGDGTPDLVLGGWNSWESNEHALQAFLVLGSTLAQHRGEQGPVPVGSLSSAVYHAVRGPAGTGGGLCPGGGIDLDGDGLPDPILRAAYDGATPEAGPPGAVYVAPGRCRSELPGGNFGLDLTEAPACDGPGEPNFPGAAILGTVPGSELGRFAGAGLAGSGSEPTLLAGSAYSVRGFSGIGPGTYLEDEATFTVAGQGLTAAVLLPDLDESGGAELAVSWFRSVAILGDPAGQLDLSTAPRLATLERTPPVPVDDIFGVGLGLPGDLDGDGISELAVLGEGGPVNGGLYLFSGADLLAGPGQQRLAAAPGTATSFGKEPVASGDFDKDGNLDLVVGDTLSDRNGASGEVLVFFGPWTAPPRQ